MDADTLTTLRVGEFKHFEAHGRTFRVRRLRQGVYHLSADNTKERSRFGSRSQIIEDVKVAVEYGVLPGPAGPRW
jgi:hypothetical protein